MAVPPGRGCVQKGAGPWRGFWEAAQAPFPGCCGQRWLTLCSFLEQRAQDVHAFLCAYANKMSLKQNTTNTDHSFTFLQLKTSQQPSHHPSRRQALLASLDLQGLGLLHCCQL